MEQGNACQQTREHGNKMYERGGPAHQCSHTFQVLGVGHIQENPRSYRFQVVPIVSTSMEAGQCMPTEPENMEIKCMKGGNLHISAAIHYWEQGSVFQDSDKVSRYLTSVWARGPSMPIENREARFQYREAGSEDRGSRIENREWRIENRESRSEDREWGLSSQVGKIDENGRQVQNKVEVLIFKYFLLLPNNSVSFLRKLNVTNFKASWKEISSRVQLSCF